MDFSISEEQQIAIDSFRKFLEAEIKPIFEEHKDKEICKADMHDIFMKMHPFGLANGTTPYEYDGYDLDAQTIGLLMHELARVAPDFTVPCLLQLICGKLLRVMGNDEQKEKYLRAIGNGTHFGCVAMSEPGAGSEVTAVNCRAKEDGDEYVINGEKLWISNGHYSDFCILLARVNDHPVKGLALFLVDREHGYETVNITKTAMNSQSTAQVFFQDVRIPKENRLCEPGDALKILFTSLGASRPLVALMSMGLAQAALEEAINYSLERVQYGKPIAGHQLTQAKLAEMATEIEAGKLLAFKALYNVDNNIRSDIMTAMSKWYCTDKAVEIVQKAVSIHGGNGVTKEFPIEYLSRAVNIFPFTEGTNEIQKLMIGRALTGIAAF